MYQDGEIWGHGGDHPRVVQIGTQRDGNFGARLAEHFLLNARKMDFDIDSPAPKDRSILRKTIGRALLNRRSDQYLAMWNQDFTERTTRVQYGLRRDISKEKHLEREITILLREQFSVRYVAISAEGDRIGQGSITRRLISTIAQCGCCTPSTNWLGRSSPSEKIRHFGLWQVQHTAGDFADEHDLDYLERSVAARLNLASV